MLSIKPFSSAGAATKYYSHGDYYGSEGEGTWYGAGAKELGLSGGFTAKTDRQFSNLLNGILPGGQVLGKKTKDGIEHRPGTDLTFSVPKSFSIQMLLYSNTEEKKVMEQALMSAVTKTLNFIEKEGYVIARKGQGGREIEKLNKLTFATFMHTTNRNLEPQAHVHCFLANVALCNDGKFRSVTIDNLLENNKFFGQIFRNELALETKKLGHEVRTTILSDGSSSFELSNIHPKLIQSFSTRRKEIVELCKLYNVTTKEGRDRIVINSRKAKRLVTQEQLIKTWKEIESNVKKEIESDAIGSDVMSTAVDIASDSNSNANSNTTTSATTTIQNGSEISEINEQDKKNKKNEKTLVEKITNSITSLFVCDINNTDNNINISSNGSNQSNESNGSKLEVFTVRDIAMLSIEDVSYNKTVFSQEELFKKTLKYSIGNLSIQDIQKEISKLEQAGILIRHENQLTTKILLDKEKQILKYAANSIGQSKQIIQEKNLDHHLQRFEKREIARNPDFQMNNQQKMATGHILTSKDKIITMEGLPGVGKSTVLNAVREISGRKIINLIGSTFGIGDKFEGTAPTASASKTLRESAKVESQTIHSLLGKYRGYIEDRGTKGSLSSLRQEYKNTIIFLDEASLVSTNIMHKLLKLQDKLGFRLVLTGDTKQLGSVEAGKAFEQMLGIIKPVKLKEVVRQKDTVHREAITEASQGNIEKSFSIHDKNIKETNSDLIAKTAAQAYFSRSSNQRDNTLLISPTRDLRNKINNEIREMLQQEKLLGGEVYNFQSLRKKDMSKADYNFAYIFNIGDIIKFNTQYKNGTNIINKGDYFQVKAKNEITNSLVLVKDDKEKFSQEKQEKKGKEFIFHLRKNVDYTHKMEVFNETDLKLQGGLKIIFTKNNKEFGLINSETAIIEQIGKHNILLKFEDNKSRSIPMNHLRHIDYGYCVTVHGAQGKTYDNTIAAINNNKLLNSAKMWLVAISRHRTEFTALVEDKNLLKTYLIKNKAIELSAIELQAKVEISKAQNSKTVDELNNNLHPSTNNAKMSNVKELQSQSMV